MIDGEYDVIPRPNVTATRVRAHLLGRTALCGAVSIGVLVGTAPRPAEAGPQGSRVVSGAVDVQRSGPHTEFTQHTPTAILNHDSFDIRQNESVNFAQPSPASLAVNRVVGTDLPTDISGKLTANGNVWVLNPSGVAVGRTAQVNVNGLLATTASISDEAILTGDHSFAGAPAGSAVSNAGRIEAGDGSVVLVAPVVQNSGTIVTSGSDVAMGAGSGFTVDFEGDGLTRFEVTPGSGISLANSGTISAEGGAAYLTAASADAVKESVVSIGGRVEASRIEEKGGVIVISGGERGVATVSGTVSAADADGTGGHIVATGEMVDITATAMLDASGASGGGTIRIGGGRRGAAPRPATNAAPAMAPLPTARRTVVRPGARIAADAGADGDGGSVIVWADEATSFQGAISARGGSNSGDGGFAEVSASGVLDFAGTADLGAAAGETGQLLLDPEEIVIADGGETETQDIFFDDPPFDLEVASVIDADFLNNALAALTLQAEGDITVDETVSASVDLSLEAGDDIFVNQDLATTGDLRLVADADFSGAGGSASDGFGTILFDGGGLSGQSVSLSAGEALSLGAVTAAADLTIEAPDIDIFDPISAETVSLVNAEGDVTNVGFDTFAGEAPNDFLIDQPDIDNIDASELEIDSAGGDIRVLSDISTTIPLFVLNAGAGSLSVENGASLSGLNLDIVGTDVSIFDDATAISAPGIASFEDSAGAGMTIGDAFEDENPSTFELTDFELATISAGTLEFLSNGGDVSVEEVSLATNAAVVRIDPQSGALSFDDDSGEGDSANTFPTLIVENASAISQTFAATLGVAGEAILTSTGDISLGSANDFSGAVNADGGNIVLDDINAIALGLITAAGDLSVDAGGTITDTAGRRISVAGATTLTALRIFEVSSERFDIALDNSDAASGDVHDFAGPLGANGEDIEITDLNDIILADIVASRNAPDSVADPTVPGDGRFTLRAGSTVTQTGSIFATDGVDIVAETFDETTDFSDIQLESASNFIQGTVSLSGEDISLVNGTSTTLALVTTHDESAGTPDPTIDNGNDGDFTLVSAGTVHDTEGQAITVSGSTSLLAGEENQSLSALDFFDILLDNAGLHDFSGSDPFDAEGEDIVVDEANAIALGAVTAHNDPDAPTGDDPIDLEATNEGTAFLVDPTIGGLGRVDISAGSRVTLGQIRADEGGIGLTTGENFVVNETSSMPLDAIGAIRLTAPGGSFFDPGSGTLALPAGLTFRSTQANVTLDLDSGFVVPGPLTLDAPQGFSEVLIDQGFLGIGSPDFLAKAQQPGFDPFTVEAEIENSDLFTVTGDLVLISGGALTVRVQNTGESPIDGGGTTVQGTTFVGGSFPAISVFGTFNGVGGEAASVEGFADASTLERPPFVISPTSTANSCVILVGTCDVIEPPLPPVIVPKETLDLQLLAITEFPDGLLLGVVFIDPFEDLDDPFSNRGDEEEWE